MSRGLGDVYKRQVYKFNDERAKIKLEINNALGSNIKEVKSYE